MSDTGYAARQRIAITTRGESPVAQIYERFGRTYWLMIYDVQKNNWEAIDNRYNRNRSQGVGVTTAQMLIRANVGVVLTGETGPKAYRTLANAGIRVVQDIGGIAEEALRGWLAGEMTPARAANDAGSPSCLMGATLAARNLRELKVFTPVIGNEIDGG